MARLKRTVMVALSLAASASIIASEDNAAYVMHAYTECLKQHTGQDATVLIESVCTDEREQMLSMFPEEQREMITSAIRDKARQIENNRQGRGGR